MGELLDQTKGWRSYAELHARQTSPRRRAMMANIMEHYKWECLGEVKHLVASVHPDAHYIFYGLGKIVEFRGHDAIAAFYQNLADTGANTLQLDIEHVLVDDEVISAAGVWHQVQMGSELMGEGLASSSEVDDPEGRYLTSQRMAWFFPYSEGDEPLLLGEHVYFHPEPVAIRKLADGEEVFGPLTEDMFRL